MEGAMKKFLLASGALAALIAAAPAVAADLGIRTPAPAYAPPVSDWTGFYVGGHAGYGWGRDPFTETFLPISGGVPGVQVFNIAPTTITGPNLNGGVFGGHFGYNQQCGNWVGGLEFDISSTSMKGSTPAASSTGTVSTTTTTVVPPFTVATTTATMPITNSMSRSDDFDVLASARARVGTLVWGNTLIYGTGGLAWTRFRSTLNQTQNLFGVGGAGPVQVATASATGVGTAFGWVAGVGGETKIYNSNWLLRVEYLHYDFGDQGSLGASGVTSSPAGTTVSLTNLTTGHLTADVVRAGISYKFGGSI
jgi:outer membrane immunogenic protein